MCHPSLDLPFEHSSTFYEQQLSFCRAVTAPRCHRWGEELWLHPMAGTAGNAPPKLAQQESTAAQSPGARGRAALTLPVLLVTPKALSAGWQEEPTLLQCHSTF